MRCLQYDVILVNLDPTVGSEIRKTRPCVVISPNEMNQYLKTVIIAPITSRSKKYPTRVEINLEGNKNWVVLDQIRTIDKVRIIKFIDDLTPQEIIKIKSVIQQMLVD